MEHKYISHCIDSLYNSAINKSNLPDEILNMDGMSGIKTRHFYNNLLNNDFLVNYLEIGTWKGSSFISAMYNNKMIGHCIDNWSEFDGPKDIFLNNIATHIPNQLCNIFNEDSFKFDINKLPKIDIYLYDGCHTYEAQKLAITYYYECLNDIFILVIDDWNWFDVQNGTRDGLKEKNITVVWDYEIKYNDNNQHSHPMEAKLGYWNGIYIAVCKK